FGECIGVLPLSDVARHVDFLRHPMVGAGGKVFFPGPFVFEGHQLVDVGGAVDDALVCGTHTARHACGLARGLAVANRCGLPHVVGRCGWPWHGGRLRLLAVHGLGGRAVIPVEHCESLYLRPRGAGMPSAPCMADDCSCCGRYWQASHSSKPSSPGRMVHTAPTVSATGRAIGAAADAAMPVPAPAETAFNSPPRPVDFSALVAPMARR